MSWLNNIGGLKRGVQNWEQAQTEAGREYHHNKERKEVEKNYKEGREKKK